MVFLGCQQEPLDNPFLENETPVVIDSAFVSPVRELRYDNQGSYFFFPGQNGRFVFGADTVGNQFKVTIKEYYSFGGPTPDSILYTYRFDTLYQLREIEKKNYSGSPPSVLKIEYTGNRISRIEETSDNIVYKTYTVIHETGAGTRKLSLAPYTVETPSLRDTITQSLRFDAQDRVINIYERLRRTGGINELWIHDMNLQYQGFDVEMIQGSQVYNAYAPAMPRKDSLWTTYAFLRASGESPVLTNYLRMLYGADLYDILNYFDLLTLQNTPGGNMELLLLPGQNRSSQDSYQYNAVVYTNGVQSHSQSAGFNSINTFDTQNRLIRSRVEGNSPNYYTWEITYR